MRVGPVFWELSEAGGREHLFGPLDLTPISWSRISFLYMWPWCWRLQKNEKGLATISIAWIRSRDVPVKYEWWVLGWVRTRKEASKGRFLAFTLFFWVQCHCLPRWTWMFPGRRKGRDCRSLLEAIFTVSSGTKCLQHSSAVRLCCEATLMWQNMREELFIKKYSFPMDSLAGISSGD